MRRIHVLHKTNGDYRFVKANIANTFDSDWLVDPDTSAVDDSPWYHWEVVADLVVLKDQAGRDAADALWDADRENQTMVNFSDEKSLLRAAILTLVDIMNSRASDFNEMKNAIVNSGSLGALQTAVAAIGDQPESVTPVQARDAILNRLRNPT